MAGYLIKDTTMEERKRIVEESLGNIEATCDGCSQRIVDMYDPYIKGEKEIAECNAAFNAGFYEESDTKAEPGCGLGTPRR